MRWTVAEAFIQDVAKLHGFPKSIINDRDHCSSSNSRLSCFVSRGPRSRWAPLTPPDRWPNGGGHWKPSFAALLQNSLPSGICGCPRQNFGITPPRVWQWPHKQQSVALRINPKLSPRYFGPYQILSQVAEVAYELKLHDSARIHPVFHVSQLWRSVQNGSAVSSLPLMLEIDDSETSSPEAILATRVRKHQGTPMEEWLILWTSQPTEEATWEVAHSIKDKFPSFCLEDKANFIGGGIDRNLVSKWNRPFKTYSKAQVDKGLTPFC